jgi:hypothetical protein
MDEDIISSFSITQVSLVIKIKAQKKKEKKDLKLLGTKEYLNL